MRAVLLMLAVGAAYTVGVSAAATEIRDVSWLFTLHPDPSGLPRGFSTHSRSADESGLAAMVSSEGAMFGNVEEPSTTSDDAWRAQLRSSTVPVVAGRAYSLEFSARSAAPNGTARAVMRDMSGGRNVPGAAVALDLQPEWQRFSLRLAMPAVDGNWSAQVHCGAHQGWYEFKGMVLTEEPLDTTIAALQPAAMDARTAAHRKGEFEVSVVDAFGRPVAATGVNMTLVRHHFVLGAAVAPEMVRKRFGDDVTSNYTRLIGENFWSLVPENAFKWYNYEPQQGNYQAGEALIKRDYITLAQNNSMELVRGHTIEWGDSYNQMMSGRNKGHWSVRSRDCDFYVKAIEGRIRRDLALFKGSFTQYDLFNELVETNSMMKACGLMNTSLPAMYKLAAQIDPKAQLCLNEWAVLEGNNWQGFVDIANNLLSAGAPLHCLGVQAHLTAGGAQREAIYRRLDEMGATGLPLYITEFSLSSRWERGTPVNEMSEDEQAERLEELVKTFFSHPSVHGLMLWGFWDGNIWIKHGGIFRSDFSPKPAALRLKKFFSETHNTTITNLEAAPLEGAAAFTPTAGAPEANVTAQPPALGAPAPAQSPSLPVAQSNSQDAVHTGIGPARKMLAQHHGRRVLKSASSLGLLQLPLLADVSIHTSIDPILGTLLGVPSAVVQAPPLLSGQALPVSVGVPQALADAPQVQQQQQQQQPRPLKFKGYYGRYRYEMMVGGRLLSGEVAFTPGDSPKLELVV